MATWNELVAEFAAKPTDVKRAEWINAEVQTALATVGTLTGDRNVILYGSAFLQKPQAPAQMVSLTHEDLDGFMAAVHRTDPARGLTLILHTPGGVTNAAETLVAYLRSKFIQIDVIVPTFAMSAGTMMSLAADSIVMGRQSQLGPIDPQMPVGGRSISARAVVDQFDRAKLEIVGDSAAGVPGELLLAHVWAPVLATIGPALLQEAQNALDYSERMVARWLAAFMFATHADADARGEAVARYFNDATQHKSHGRRIDRDEARSQGVVVRDLEDDQALQEQVLTLYHLMTIVFQHSATAKMIQSTAGGAWMKNWASPEPPLGPPQRPSGPIPAPLVQQQGPNRAARRQEQRRKG